MEFWNVFLNLCNRIDKSANAVAKEIGIPSGSVTAWKNGTIPQTKTLNKISEYFNVTVEYLLGKEKSPAGAELSEKHKRLINAYDGAEPLVQSTVDKLLGIDEREMITLKIAARGGSGKIEEKEITKEQWEQIKNAADLEI